MSENKNAIQLSYAPEEVGEYYNRYMPEVVKKIKIDDTMQGCRPKETADLHDYIIRTAELNDGQKILDAGCGLGGPSCYFAGKLKADIHSWTNSAFTYDYFSGKLETIKSGLKGKVTPYLRDYHTLADYYPPATFDRILFLESFLHTRTPLQLLKDVRKILKDDGILYLKEICSEEVSKSPHREKIEHAILVGNEHFKYHYETVHQLSTYLKDAGFEILICRKPQFENYLDLGNQYLYELANVDFFEKDRDGFMVRLLGVQMH